MPSAPLTVAVPLELPSPAGPARATAARTFGRCPDEVPAARRFLRERARTCVWFELVPDR
jgi:hypothetical protein